MTEPYGGGAAAPYKSRRRRRSLKKLALLPRTKVPKPPVKQVGGGVAAPGPLKIAPFKGR